MLGKPCRQLQRSSHLSPALACSDLTTPDTTSVFAPRWSRSDSIAVDPIRRNAPSPLPAHASAPKDVPRTSCDISGLVVSIAHVLSSQLADRCGRASAADMSEWEDDDDNVDFDYFYVEDSYDIAVSREHACQSWPPVVAYAISRLT